MLAKVGLMAGVALALMAGTAGAATINVDVINDELNADGDCSLREAVQAARLNSAVSGCKKGQSSRDTIELKGETYQLGIASTNEDLNANGDLDVTGNGPITVQGKGFGDTTINQGGADRVFDVLNPNGDLTLAKLRVNGGDASGLLPVGEARGGNVLAEGGKLTVQNVQMTAGAAVSGGSLGTIGTAKVKIKNSEFLSSDATSATESAHGGAISHDGSVKMKITGTEVQGSTAETSGAADAALGGGIYTVGPMNISRSLISGNGTSAGVDNVQENGGGIYHVGNDLKIVNSTLFNNNAGSGGDNDGDGGAIFSNSGDVSAEAVTFDVNQASDEGGQMAVVGGALSFSYSIVVGGSVLDPCDGSFGGSGGFNVADFDDPECAYLGDDAVAPSITDLGSLGENGGPTETIPIAATSVAKDFVPKKKCKTATGNVDQRGFERPKGPKCDAGAFELGANP